MVKWESNALRLLIKNVLRSDDATQRFVLLLFVHQRKIKLDPEKGKVKKKKTSDNDLTLYCQK